jgi:hypothetical protein
MEGPHIKDDAKNVAKKAGLDLKYLGFWSHVFCVF